MGHRPWEVTAGPSTQTRSVRRVLAQDDAGEGVVGSSPTLWKAGTKALPCQRTADMDTGYVGHQPARQGFVVGFSSTMMARNSVVPTFSPL